MKINGLTPAYFDIETTGFSSWEDNFVCSAVLPDDPNYEYTHPNVATDIPQTFMITDIFDNTLIITWNGENWKGGFDFPFLRSKCIQEGIEWKLAGVKHLDLLPLVRKYINTTHYVTEIPSKSSLRAGDLKKLASANGIEYKNMKQAWKELIFAEDNGGADWLDYIESEAKEDNSLQAVYQMMFDPQKEETYLSGAEIPSLYEQYKEGNSEDAYCMKIIENHNQRDVERLKKIAEKVIPVIPDWEIERNIKEL